MGIDSVFELQVACVLDVYVICFFMGASRLDPQNVREIDKIIYIYTFECSQGCMFLAGPKCVI